MDLPAPLAEATVNNWLGNKPLVKSFSFGKGKSVTALLVSLVNKSQASAALIKQSGLTGLAFHNLSCTKSPSPSTR